MSSDHVQLKATPRTVFGTSYTRRLRAAGLVPGVLYKSGEDSIAFTLPERDINRALHGGHGKTAVFQIAVDGHPTVPALLKDWDLNPVRGSLIHVDFQQVDLLQEVETSVPLVLNGIAVGVRDGGVLGQPVHEVVVRALPDAIPDGVEVDVSALEAGGVQSTDLLLEVIPPFEQDDAEVLGDLWVSVDYWRNALERRGHAEA
jgi:large subunit ribosomal protein L25